MRRDVGVVLVLYLVWFAGLIPMSAAGIPRDWFNLYLVLPFAAPLAAIAVLSALVKIMEILGIVKT